MKTVELLAKRDAKVPPITVRFADGKSTTATSTSLSDNRVATAWLRSLIERAMAAKTKSAA